MKGHSLQRYSKRRGPGDQTSGGRGKLLRPTTDLTRTELLVRETLQNSWDAALDDWYPAYGLRIRTVTEEIRTVLRDEVFHDLPQTLETLRESLADPAVHVLEIYDRGTTGLDGPVRASEVPEPGESSNFNSFVFDIGTTKASKTSGGTFGFGKTAAFDISWPHTVVYWSVTQSREDEDELEHRFIASSLHEPYEEDGARFTGAHWWGMRSVGDIEPVRGEEAQRLGEALFETHFGEDETGTSILVIDPVITMDSHVSEAAGERVPIRTVEHAETLVDRATRGLVRNAWPKAITGNDGHTPMIVQLFNQDDEFDVTAKMADQASRFAYPLRRIRAEQEGDTSPQAIEKPTGLINAEIFPIRLRPSLTSTHTREEYFGDRSDNIVGHLCLAMIAAPEGSVSALPGNRVCYMRSDAELVVNYDTVVQSDLGPIEWTGVFKPTPECDHHFASAEPPSHDAWTPNSADSEVGTYVVEKAIQQVRRKVKDFITPNQAAVRTGNRSVRTVANALSSFVPLDPDPASSTGDEPRSARRQKSRTRRADRLTADIIDAQPLADGKGQLMGISVTGIPATSIDVSVRLYAVTSDGRMELEDSEASTEWVDVRGRPMGTGRTIEVEGPKDLRLTVATRTAIAFEAVVTAEANA